MNVTLIVPLNYHNILKLRRLQQRFAYKTRFQACALSQSDRSHAPLAALNMSGLRLDCRITTCELDVMYDDKRKASTSPAGSAVAWGLKRY